MFALSKIRHEYILPSYEIEMSRIVCPGWRGSGVLDFGSPTLSPKDPVVNRLVGFDIRYCSINVLGDMQENCENEGGCLGPGMTAVCALSYVVGIAVLIFVARKFGFWAFELKAIKLQIRLVALVVLTLILTYGAFLFIVACMKLRNVSKVTVFLSYYHALENVADTVSSAIRSDKLNVFMLPYRPLDHDNVINEVISNIRKADVVLVIPSDQRGFFESEILVATSLEKPILFLSSNDSFTLPSTAYSGYPVLSVNILGDHKYEPLRNLIHYAADSRESVDYAKHAALSDTFSFILAIGFLAIVVGFPLSVLINLISLVVLMSINDPDSFITAYTITQDAVMFITVIAVACAVIGNLLKAFHRNNHLRQVIRQQIKTKNLTNSVLRNLLEGQEFGHEILSSLWR